MKPTTPHFKAKKTITTKGLFDLSLGERALFRRPLFYTQPSTLRLHGDFFTEI